MPLERKPYWREVPQELKDQIASTLGAPVRRAVRVFGGYGPSATFRLFLADGRTAFAKGAGLRATEHHWAVLPREERAYREVAAIRRWAPKFYGAVRCEGWHLLLLEDLQGATWVPPWTEALAARAVEEIAALHIAGCSETLELHRFPVDDFASVWASLAPQAPDREGFLQLFGPRREDARRWLDMALPSLAAHAALLARPDQPFGAIHADIRSDNLAFRGKDLVLFDWADLSYGPLAADIAGFLPSLAAEGGPAAADMAQRYCAALARGGVEMPIWALHGAVSAIAGYFASRAGRPPAVGLPRLRAVQRQQLSFALPWIAGAAKLPPPPAAARDR